MKVLTKTKFYRLIKKAIPAKFRYQIRKRFEKRDFPINSKDIRRLRSMPRNTHTYFKILDKEIEITDPYWFLHSYDELLVKQIYRFRTTTPNPMIIDCGANIGLSVIFFKYIYPDSSIIAFEPDVEIFEILRKNLSKFDYTGIELHNKAVWKLEDFLEFEPDGSVGGRISVKETNRPTVKVPGVRLRDFLNHPIDLLKIDVEGAEYEIIVDCQDVLWNVDRLFFEYHSNPKDNQSLHEMIKIVQDAGFRYHIQDANPIKHPFVKEERNTFYDLQLNIFCFRD